MNTKDRGEFRVRLSTVFLLLGFFCLMFEFIPMSSISGAIGVAIEKLFQIPWIALVFWQLGPLWPVIGAAFALIGITVNFQKARVVKQSLVEIVLCVIVFILFPVY